MLCNSSLAARLGFYSFLILFSILPISFRYVSPPLIALYAGSLAYLLFCGRGSVGWQGSNVWRVATVNIAIYVYFGIYSLMLGEADRSLIFKDSVGYIFYPAFFSLSALMVCGEIQRAQWEKFLVGMGLALSIFHFVAFIAFYKWSEGQINIHDATAEANAFLRENFGSAFKFGTTSDDELSMLRVDSCMGPLLLLPILICFSRILSGASLKSHLAIAVLIPGLLLEGHRALFIAALLTQIMYFCWSAYTADHVRAVFARGASALISMGAGLLVMIAILGSHLDMEQLWGRFVQTADQVSNQTKQYTKAKSVSENSIRLDQIGPLIDKIAERPFMGNGFGAHASIIRNAERPYMYEMDYLAVIMKLGLIGGAAYFGAYLYLLYLAAKNRKEEPEKMVYFFAGLAYLLFAGTNGGLAMSVYSTLFQLYLMFGLSVKYSRSSVERS